MSCNKVMLIVSVWPEVCSYVDFEVKSAYLRVMQMQKERQQNIVI